MATKTLLGPLHAFHRSRGFIFNPHEAFPLNKQAHLPLLMKRNKQLSKSITATAATDITLDPAQVDITWQIVVGSLAGVTPFVVAGIEFSKRIVKHSPIKLSDNSIVKNLTGTRFLSFLCCNKWQVKQRKCDVCGGSGLVLKNKFYKRCPSCGGFLPWQSWRRFFTG